MPASIETTSPVRASVARLGCPPRVVDLDALPGSALLTTTQVAALSGFAEVTLKLWRRHSCAKGPQVVRVEGRPRYRVSDVREWLAMPDPKIKAA